MVLKDDVPYRQLEAMRMIGSALWDYKSMPTDILVNKKSRFEDRAAAPTLEQEIQEKGRLIYG